jgi:hypothetical protein
LKKRLDGSKATSTRSANIRATASARIGVDRVPPHSGALTDGSVP